MAITHRNMHYGVDFLRCLFWLDGRLSSKEDFHKTTIFMYNNNKGSGPIISFGIDINMFDIKPYIKESKADTLDIIYPMKLKGDAANTWTSTVGSSFSISISESLEIAKALLGTMWSSLSQALLTINVQASDLPNPVKTVLVSLIYETGKTTLLSSLGSHISSGNFYNLARAIEVMDKTNSKQYGPNLGKILDKRKEQADYIRAWLDTNSQSKRPDPLGDTSVDIFVRAKNLWDLEEETPIQGPDLKSHEDFLSNVIYSRGNTSSLSLCEFDKADGKLNVYHGADQQLKEYKLIYPTQFKSKKEVAYDSNCRITDTHAKFLKDILPYMPPGVSIIQGYKDPTEHAQIAIDVLTQIGMTDVIKAVPGGATWSGDVASRLSGSFGSIGYPYIDWNAIKSSLNGIGIEWDLPGKSLHQLGMAIDFAVLDQEYDKANNVSDLVFDIIKWFISNHVKMNDNGEYVSYHDIKSVYYENNGAIQVEFINEFYPGVKGDGKTDSSATRSVIINDNTINEIYSIFKRNDFYDVNDSPYLTDEEKAQAPTDLRTDKTKLSKAISEIFDYMLYGPRGAISVGVNTQFEYTNARINGVATGVDTIIGSVESLGAVGLTSAVGTAQKISTASSCTNPIVSSAAVAGPAKDSIMKTAADWKARLNERTLGRIKGATSSGANSVSSSSRDAGKPGVASEGGLVSVVPGESVSPQVINGYASVGDEYRDGVKWTGYKAKAGSKQYDAITSMMILLKSEYELDHDRTSYNVIHMVNSDRYIKVGSDDGYITEIIKKSGSHYVVANHNTMSVLEIKVVDSEDVLTSRSFKWKPGAYSEFLSYVG